MYDSNIRHQVATSQAVENGLRAVPLSQPPVVCREIETKDLEELATLLTEGFPSRDRSYWLYGLGIMQARFEGGTSRPLGYVLVSNDQLVGVLLTIHSPDDANGVKGRCNLSSWYIEPEYRGAAIALERLATADPALTYTSISPAPHTRRLMSVLRHRSLNEDALLALPTLAPIKRDARIQPYSAQHHDRLLSPDMARICSDHKDLDCIVLIAQTQAGAHPFIFQKRPLTALKTGCADIIFSPSDDLLSGLAGPLGRFLLRQGIFLWKLEARTHLKGVPYWSFTGKAPRLVKGAGVTLANDLTYSELVVFGP